MAATAVLVEERLARIEGNQAGAIGDLKRISFEVTALAGLREGVETAIDMVRTAESERAKFAAMRAERDRHRDAAYELRFKSLEEKYNSATNNALALAGELGVVARELAGIRREHSAEVTVRREMDSAHDVAITEVKKDVAVVQKDVKRTKMQLAKTVGKTGLGALGIVQILEFVVKVWPEISKYLGH